MSNLDLTKPIQTRDGDKVDSPWEIENGEAIAAQICPRGRSPEWLVWNSDGSFRDDGVQSPLDLINVPEDSDGNHK